MRKYTPSPPPWALPTPGSSQGVRWGAVKPVIFGAPAVGAGNLQFRGSKPFLTDNHENARNCIFAEEKYSSLQKQGAGNLHELKRLPELTFLFLKGEGFRPPGALTIQGFVRQPK